MAIDIIVPPLGESITQAVIALWLRKVGEAVALDEPIAELETDKVTVELRAPAAGVLSQLLFPAGATVRVGDVVARMEPSAASKLFGADLRRR